MADELAFTDLPIRITASGKQKLNEVLDVGFYDELDLQFILVAVDASASLTIKILSSMYPDNEDGWVTIGTFTNATLAGNVQRLSVRNLLRYVRYEAVLTGSGATFLLSGMARSWR